MHPCIYIYIYIYIYYELNKGGKTNWNIFLALFLKIYSPLVHIFRPLQEKVFS